MPKLREKLRRPGTNHALLPPYYTGSNIISHEHTGARAAARRNTAAGGHTDTVRRQITMECLPRMPKGHRELPLPLVPLEARSSGARSSGAWCACNKVSQKRQPSHTNSSSQEHAQTKVGGTLVGLSLVLQLAVPIGAVPLPTCLGWCNQWTCDMDACLACGPSKGCEYLSPPPPANPGHCGHTYQPCSQTKCCVSEGDRCFKKAGKVFAMCRPHSQLLNCGKDGDDWECPDSSPLPPRSPSPPMTPPPPPSPGKYKQCWSGHLDEQEVPCELPNFGCFRRRGKRFAQCRPLVTPCIDNPESDWVCPGWSLAPPDPPTRPPPLPARPPPSSPPQPPPPCVLKYKDCWDHDSNVPRCCESPQFLGNRGLTDFACYRRKDINYAQCRPLPQDGPCVSDERWECSVAPPPSPPRPPWPPSPPPMPPLPPPDYPPGLAPSPRRPAPSQPPSPPPLKPPFGPSLSVDAALAMISTSADSPTMILVLAGCFAGGFAVVLPFACYLGRRCRRLRRSPSKSEPSAIQRTPCTGGPATATDRAVGEKQKKQTGRCAPKQKTKAGKGRRCKEHAKLSVVDEDEIIDAVPELTENPSRSGKQSKPGKGKRNGHTKLCGADDDERTEPSLQTAEPVVRPEEATSKETTASEAPFPDNNYPTLLLPPRDDFTV